MLRRAECKGITGDSAGLAKLKPSFTHPTWNMRLRWFPEMEDRLRNQVKTLHLCTPKIMYIKFAHTLLARALSYGPTWGWKGPETDIPTLMVLFLLNIIDTGISNIQTIKWIPFQEVDTYYRNCAFSNILINFLNFYQSLKLGAFSCQVIIISIFDQCNF